MNLNLQHPCIMYLNQERYQKELEFAKILNEINTKLYTFADIGEERVHLYYIDKILNNLTTCVQNNSINIECTELMQILSIKKKLIQPNKLNVRVTHGDKKQAILNNAIFYLQQFNLKPIDFCINDANIKLMHTYRDINEWLSKHSPICPLCQLQWTDYQIYSNISN